MIRTRFFRESQYSRHDTDRADRDARWTDIQSAAIADDFERGHHRVVIVQRFAHAHEHKIPQTAFATRMQQATRLMHLRDDLARAQMSPESHLPRRAKHTAHRATCLRAQTRCETGAITHDNRLDGFAVVEAQKQFPRPSVIARDFANHVDSIRTKAPTIAAILFEPTPQWRHEMSIRR